MGAHSFEDQAFGKDFGSAYRAAYDQAIWEYGHDGYNGTISTTGSAVEVRCPKRLTSDEFISLAWMVHDNNDMAVPPVRRKFSDEWERKRYLNNRALLKKYNELLPADRAEIVRASKFEKWENCIGFAAPDKEQRKMRESNPGYKGKHGKFYHFFGWAAS